VALQTVVLWGSSLIYRQVGQKSGVGWAESPAAELGKDLGSRNWARD